MKKRVFGFYSITEYFGGSSIDTVQDSDLDKFLFFLDHLQKSKMKGFYSSPDIDGIRELFIVANN